MNKKKVSLIILFFLAAFTLSSCAGLLQGSSWPGISSNDGVLYVANMNHVYAVRVSDGSMLWRFPEQASGMFFAAPVLVDGQLLAGNYEGRFYSLDASTGRERWVFTGSEGDWIASPLVVDGIILAPNSDHYLYALNKDGNLLWKFQTGRPIWSSPVSDGEQVFVASMDRKLYALDLQTGTQVWELDLGGAVIYSPTLGDDGIIYLTTLARNLVAIDSATGEFKWQRTFENTLWTQPALYQDRLYFGDLAGNIFAVSTEDGANIWTQNVGKPVTGKPTVMDGTVIFPIEEGELIATNHTGERMWSKTVEGRIFTGPLVIGDRLALGITGGPEFLKLLNTSGQDIWTFAPPN